jgi:Spx/MgsR family transcriptional regulator
MTTENKSVVLYGIKNCDTIKKAKKWLDSQGLDYRFHDYRVDGIDETLLQQFLQSHSWEILLNKRGTTWRQQSNDVKNTIDQTRALALMLEHPAMIKRPVLTMSTSKTNNSLVGFKADQYHEFFITN